MGQTTRLRSVASDPAQHEVNVTEGYLTWLYRLVSQTEQNTPQPATQGTVLQSNHSSRAILYSALRL
jgi:hypothetical protein